MALMFMVFYVDRQAKVTIKRAGDKPGPDKGFRLIK